MAANQLILLYNFFSCQVFAFIGSLSGIGAGMTNACIAYDRYNVITRPFEAKLTKTKALFITFLIWGYTVPWAVLPLLEVWGRYVPGEFKRIAFISSTFLFLSTVSSRFIWQNVNHIRGCVSPSLFNSIIDIFYKILCVVRSSAIIGETYNWMIFN